MQTQNQVSNFLQKQEELEGLKDRLKQEFFGIENVIDTLINSIRSWYIFPDLQDKPLIINLWGMTGVGKSSLVKKIVKELQFESVFYHIDMGGGNDYNSFSANKEEILAEDNDLPIVFALDEFQMGRTVVGANREEIEDEKNRPIWEFIDTGCIKKESLYYEILQLKRMIEKLKLAHLSGVEAENGRVSKGIDVYQDVFDNEDGRGFNPFNSPSSKQEEEENWFIPISQHEDLLDLYKIEGGISPAQFRKKLCILNAEESIQFAEDILKKAKKSKTKVFKQALIFVLGNLDEAYPMSDDYNVEIDADLFYKMSLDISIIDIKKALQNRFRDEQISRLGNTHIIYPSLNKRSYEQIISLRLHKYIHSLKKKVDFDIAIHPSVNELIYNEGVYPTQGARPVITTIDQLFKSNFSLFYTEIKLKGIQIDRLEIVAQKDALIGSYFKDGEVVHRFKVKLSLSLGELQKNKSDDHQAIIAVHESGHAVLAIVLLNKIPDVIYSVSSSSDNKGLTFINWESTMLTPKTIIKRGALLIGGLVAEELVFGKENKTNGASSDIAKATKIFSDMYKESGFGEIPITYELKEQEDNGTYHEYTALEEIIKKRIVEAKELAVSTLKQHKFLLLELANYLSDHSFITKEQIKAILQKEGVEIAKTKNFYRKRLKDMVGKEDKVLFK